MATVTAFHYKAAALVPPTACALSIKVLRLACFFISLVILSLANFEPDLNHPGQVESSNALTYRRIGGAVTLPHTPLPHTCVVRSASLPPPAVSFFLADMTRSKEAPSGKFRMMYASSFVMELHQHSKQR